MHSVLQRDMAFSDQLMWRCVPVHGAQSTSGVLCIFNNNDILTTDLKLYYDLDWSVLEIFRSKCLLFILISDYVCYLVLFLMHADLPAL